MAPATAGATDMSRAAAGATDMSRAAAGATDMSPAAAGAPDMSRAAAAMTTTAAAAMTSRKSYALAKRWIVFFVEDVEGRQAYVRDFFFTENNSVWVVLRHYILCRRGC
jgi:hypothetical protein